MKYADLHSHILPYIDDGAKDLDIAVELISNCVNQGIDTIVFTPHYYPSRENSVNKFLEKRNKSFELLKNELIKRNIPMPEMKLGAEILFDCDLSEVSDIEKLKIEGTDYILLEMPDSTWQTWMFDYIYNLIAQKNIVPIIAHIERYSQTKEIMDKLKRLDVYFQINSSSIVHKVHSKNVNKLLKDGDVHFISTDTHSIKGRPPQMDKAMKIIEKKYGQEYVKNLVDNSYKVINNELCYKKEADYYTYPKKRSLFGSLFK